MAKRKTPSKAKTGRPDKLTPEIAARIALAVQGGMFPAQAAQYSGINPATYYRWMKQGREETEGRFCEFCESIRRAEATNEFTKVAEVKSQGVDDWRAAAWHLERRFRKRWGKQTNVEHKGAVDLTITGENSPMCTPEELAKRMMKAACELAAKTVKDK